MTPVGKRRIVVLTSEYFQDLDDALSRARKLKFTSSSRLSDIGDYRSPLLLFAFCGLFSQSTDCTSRTKVINAIRLNADAFPKRRTHDCLGFECFCPFVNGNFKTLGGWLEIFADAFGRYDASRKIPSTHRGGGRREAILKHSAH